MSSFATLQTTSSPQIPLSLSTSLVYFYSETLALFCSELDSYAQARLGGNRPAETTGAFVVAKFEHDTARPVDGYAAPQLHTHAVIFNVTERENGQTRALQERALFESQQFATAVYQSELTYPGFARLDMRSHQVAAALPKSRGTLRNISTPQVRAVSRFAHT